MRIHLLLMPALALFAGPTAAQNDSWYSEVIQVMADGQSLDTGDRRPSKTGEWIMPDISGHAAPELYDWDKDGVMDLLVGGFAGRVRIYLNQGSNRNPVFGGFDWIMAEGEVAKVRNWCCIPTGIRMVDINGDGIDDVTMGSYTPGLIYWFKGGEAGFASRRTLTDVSGVPILTGIDTLAGGTRGSTGAKPAWMDWDDDGALDLVIGNVQGDLVVRRKEGAASDGVTVIADQPRYARYSGHGSSQLNVYDFIVGPDNPLEDQRYLVPDAAEWDQDGLTDLLVGTKSGAVYLLRNIGEAGAPQFATPEVLLPAPDYPDRDPPRLLLKGDEQVGRGSRASIDVADYNDDGKLDLLVGDWARSIRARGDLSRQERRAFEDLQRQLVDLDRSAGIDGPPLPFRDRFKGVDFYRENHFAEQSKTLRSLQQELFSTYLELVHPEIEGRWSGYTRNHGHVWVYLRK